MTADALLVLEELAGVGVVLTVDAGQQLRYRAPAGAMTPELRERLVAHKPALLALLAPQAAPVAKPVPTLPCALPACRGVVITDYDGVPYCRGHQPPTAPCPGCGAATWRCSTWGGWRCRICLPSAGRTTPRGGAA